MADDQQEWEDDMGVVEASGELPPTPPPIPRKPVWICLDCYSVDHPKKVYPASGGYVFAIFGIGSIAFLLGVLYSGLLLGPSFIVGAILFAFEGWRTGTAKAQCRHCGSARIIPPDSPRGRQLQGLE